MCGIAGIFHYADPAHPVDRSLLERMTRALAHRGPDGEGFHVDGPLGLGHRRLAIVDLTPTGAQPMASPDRARWITYNGEFYDHADHREALSRRHAFRGRSDTETMLALLSERGPEALGGISAIFGLAFWDGSARTLTLARDALGVKQVYFHDDGCRLIFASEIKALLEDPKVARALDPEAVNQFLHFHTPLFERTFFRTIRQVQPGEFLQWRVGASPRRARFWELRGPEDVAGRPQEVVSALGERLSGVVAQQLMSDVPVGTFFSGGIDSSAVASYAARAGQRPQCFGVHFADQGVIDERPYQEAAAKALGLELELLTLDGTSFAEDLPRLLRQQDQPVIGPALIPMFHVSRLAARKVKVCLGGQAADELFGGYARYGLTHPLRTVASMLRGGGGQVIGSAGPRVGGNLRRQLLDPRTFRRAVKGLGKLLDWQDLYFSNFCKVPESTWASLFEAEGIVSRESCWEIFRETVRRSPLRDPASRVMHWDLQAYLPGLFQQDDRMSMASGLESRVPFADPRLVEFAFSVPFELKVREGASKWLLRRAVADVLPELVLGRRKVGFDTPVEQWMSGPHAGFVRETLLSRPARQRGLWRPAVLEQWLSQPGRDLWPDIVWKALCIELWAQQLLDSPRRGESAAVPEVQGTSAQAAAPATAAERPGFTATLRELRELGPGGLAFRLKWEAKLRSGLLARGEAPLTPLAPANTPETAALTGRLPFQAQAVASLMRDRMPAADRARLVETAERAALGEIRAFGRWDAFYGRPPDWHLNPVNGRRWPANRHWSKVLRDERRVGDIKLSWEIGRFPHAYAIARAGTHAGPRPDLQAALADQLVRFEAENPFPLGAHWASGQEIAFRLMAWLFALGASGPDGAVGSAGPLIARALHGGAAFIERHLEYTLKAVYNNHLLSEALALLLAGELLPTAPDAERWRDRGLALLTGQADRQFYEDGGYIQQSHNYERVALQDYLWATALLRQAGREVPAPWLGAMGRAVDFLFAQQNPIDGRLPNYGANDGALPSPLTSCDYSDFRPTLQAASLASRGERLYDSGPWDEEAAWLLGSAALEAPLRAHPRRSVSFRPTGFHVLRGDDPSTFAAFRCGTVRDRFSQIDMLSLDVWWRGQNVIVDPGSYHYNGADRWHEHFMCTPSHSTVVVDGRDQMLHYRRFKNLYWTEAELLGFDDQPAFTLAEGRHFGYRRHPGQIVHGRSVLHVKDGLWIVADRLTGAGEHHARLHWLGGEHEWAYDHQAACLTLTTPAGPFYISIFDAEGLPLAGSVVAGQSDPPRGWLSRYYGEKRPVPSLAIERHAVVPIVAVSLLSAGRPRVEVAGERWTAKLEDLEVQFTLADGRFKDVRISRAGARPGQA
ncbi:MAG: asparagine synthase (glutamine-hydrolyzing) [Anaeromyxobacter sp.]